MNPRDLAIRNIGIVAHINAGKTTLGERILFAAGRLRSVGEVEHGTAALDWLRDEQRRGISIETAIAKVRWRGYLIHVLDTPGHVDFTAEVARCLRVLDGVVVVLDGVKGVESQTRTVWRQAERWNVPRLVFVNKMDRTGADFDAALTALREQLGVKVAPIFVPWLRDGALAGTFDAVEGPSQALTAHQGPANAAALRARLVETCAEVDDEVLAAFLDNRDPEPGLLRSALRRAVLANRLVPVLGGAALRNVGVPELLDAICAYLPSPADVPLIRGTTPPGALAIEGTTFCALVFKRQAEQRPTLHLIRIYSGSVRAGDWLGRSASQELCQVQRLWEIHLDQRAPLDVGLPGDVIGIETEAALRTGETLFSPGQRIELEPAQFPRPVLVMGLEPKTAADAIEVEAAARALVADDPTLLLEPDPEGAGLLVRGMGELHLDVFGDRLQERVGGRARLGRPAVTCREAVRRAGRGRAECRLGGEGGPFSIVEVEILPAPGTGTATSECLAADLVRARPVLAEIDNRLRTGLAHPYAAIDLVVRLLEVSGSATGDAGATLDLEAWSVACRKALLQAEPVVLEPWMEFEIESPANTLAVIQADLRSRGAEIVGVNRSGTQVFVSGRVALAPMLGALTRLRSLSRGLATLSLAPCGFMPRAAEGHEKRHCGLDPAEGAR